MTVRIRVIPCLDVADGRVVKGVNFVDLKDAGDPVAVGDAEGLRALAPIALRPLDRRAVAHNLLRCVQTGPATNWRLTGAILPVSLSAFPFSSAA